MRLRPAAAGAMLAALGLAACGARHARPALILLITVDTLRADHLGAYGFEAPITPALDKLAAESTVFDAAFAPTSTTRPSLAAIMTSHYPAEVGVTGNTAPMAPQAMTLARWLKARGFRTAAVVSSYIVRRASGLDAGFDTYDDAHPVRFTGGAERRSRATTSDAAALLDSLQPTPEKPVFLWIHYMDPHGPYLPPDELRARYLPRMLKAPDALLQLPISRDHHGQDAIPTYQYQEGHREPAYYRAGYAGEVAFVDHSIGELLRRMARGGLAERSVVIVTADHGESLGEDGQWFAHSDAIHLPLVRVPLLVKVPGRAPARRADTASLLDLFPTIAALVGAQPPAGLRGEDLLRGATPRNRVLYFNTLQQPPWSSRGVLYKDSRYLAWDTPPRREAFMPRDRDVWSGEALDVDAVSREELRRELARAEASIRGVAPGPRAPVDAEELERLRSLGYVDGDQE